jgi:hypothetical protein
LNEGLGVTPLPKEAGVLICSHCLERRFKRVMDVIRFVGVPLEVPTHPVQKPLLSGSDELHPGKSRLAKSGLVLPVRPDLNDVDRVTGHHATKVQLWADVFRRSLLLKEPLQRAFVDRALELCEGHGNRFCRIPSGCPVRDA